MTISSVFGGDLRNDFSLPGSESHAAADLLEEGGFVGAAGERGQIVFAASDVDERPEQVPGLTRTPTLTKTADRR